MGGTIREVIADAVRRAVSGRDVAVAFSGGLDSGLLAHYSARFAESVTLYVVGTENSHDLAAAEHAAAELALPIVKLIFGERDVEAMLSEMIGITGTTNPLTLAFEVPLFKVCGGCREPFVLTGQGSDEMFGGYSKYSGLDAEAFETMRGEDISRLMFQTLPHEGKLAARFGKTPLYPYLDPELSGYISSMGAAAVMPRGILRKELLRAAASEEGLDFLASKPKKAAQYGSGFSDIANALCRRRGIRYSDLVAEIVSRRV